MTRVLRASAVFLVGWGCGGPSGQRGGIDADIQEDAYVDQVVDLPAEPPHAFLRVDVSPANTLHEVDIGASKTIPLIVVAYFSDDNNEIITDKVTWEVTNPGVGAMMGANFVTAPRATVGADTTFVKAKWTMGDGQAQITVVSYRMTGPKTDFFFTLPYMDKGGPKDRPLDFSTAIKKMDVFFAMDTTGSMDGEVMNLSTNIASVMDAIKLKTPDTQAGLGMFEDFPVSPYGNFSGSATCLKTGMPDQPFTLIQPITDDVMKQKDATKKLFGTAVGYTARSHGCGDDWPESYLEALYQIATGEGITVSGTPTSVPAHMGGRGGVEFRDGTLPIIVQIGDATFHTVGEPGRSLCGSSTEYAAPVASFAHDRVTTTKKLNDLCAKYVGISSSPSTCLNLVDMEKMARETKSMIPPYAWGDTVADRPAGCAVGQCCTGYSGAGRAPDGSGLCPAVAQINENGSGLDTSMVTTINALAKYSTFDVTAEKSGGTMGENGEMLPMGKTTADFIQSIVPFDSVPPMGPPTVPKPTIDTVANAFLGVTPATTVQFTVKGFNDFQMSTDKPQFFRAKIKVVSDAGCSDLDERDVFILVPPKGAGTVGGGP